MGLKLGFNLKNGVAFKSHLSVDEEMVLKVFCGFKIRLNMGVAFRSYLSLDEEMVLKVFLWV